jgi:pyruvate/2-oxoglutarate/acetoin dehydrogenase E1 component/pyruvate/2-oxoglutarate dehydrogenase complex dihydrolipoamide acyltransferase (E2) component
VSAAGGRVAEALNGALHDLFDAHPDLVLLGEDVADPYGGAFRITRNLSTRHPERVLSTPISESAILGAAGGLALAGRRVLVEVMFGDFLALGFDQLVNFAAKSATMYGVRKPMRLVVRCPVGGHRGYGPTHSQSLQKHFIGVPGLALYELSAFHDPRAVFEAAFAGATAAIVFEHKVLYTQRTIQSGRLDELWTVEPVDPAGEWMRIRSTAALDPGRPEPPELVLITPGGSAAAALAAAREPVADGRARVQVLVPRRLWPLDLGPVLAEVARAEGVCVAEESTAGGTWGTEVFRVLHERLWGTLRRPVRLLSSRDSVIPAAPHLERAVLLQTEDIREALLDLLESPTPPQIAVAVRADAPPETAAAATADVDTAAAAPAGTPILVPKLNPNDESYVFAGWLVDEGARVEPGMPLAEIETSKAMAELEAEGAGYLRRAAGAGDECRPGQSIGLLCETEAAAALDVPVPAASTASAEPESGAVLLDKVQQQVARVVSASHRDIPAAFAVRRVRLDAFEELQRELDEAGAVPVGLMELVVKLVADQRDAFPLCFAEAVGPDRSRPARGSHVGVTMDAGRGLFIPVVRDADRRGVAEIADELAGFGMSALRGAFAEAQLAGASIVVSWNHQPDVLLVQPLIPPGVACAVSVGGPIEEVRLDPEGRPAAGRWTALGLAHDHRLVNGAAAVALLDALAGALEDPRRLRKLTG